MIALSIAVLLAGEPASRFPPCVPLASIAGFGFWTDVAGAGTWRLQRHAVYGIHRVVHERGNCIASGDERRCRAAFAQRVAGRPPIRHAVVLIHGAQRTRGAMQYLAGRVRTLGMTPVAFEYASAHLAIEDSSACLAKFVAALDAERVDFVCHSMGGLVLRDYLAKHPTKRVKRIVMLGVPNRGAEAADFFHRCPAFQWIFGPAGVQLTSGPLGVASKLPKKPPTGVEVALVSGVLDASFPWTDRKRAFALHDGLISVECTRLDGAVDHALVATTHGGMLRNRTVAEAVSGFLRDGVLNPISGRRRDFDDRVE